MFRSKDNGKGNGRPVNERTTRKPLKADDRPRYEGKSDAEVAADIERRRGPIKFRR